MKMQNVSDQPTENRFRPYHIALLAVLIVGTIFVAQREHGTQDNTPFQTGQRLSGKVREALNS